MNRFLFHFIHKCSRAHVDVIASFLRRDVRCFSNVSVGLNYVYGLGNQSRVCSDISYPAQSLLSTFTSYLLYCFTFQNHWKIRILSNVRRAWSELWPFRQWHYLPSTVFAEYVQTNVGSFTSFLLYCFTFQNHWKFRILSNVRRAIRIWSFRLGLVIWLFWLSILIIGINSLWQISLSIFVTFSNPTPKNVFQEL
jgi:hypothetical protein